MFHKWMAVGSIASMLNRRCWMWRRSDKSNVSYQSYPGQIIVCLVGSSGELRKSTAVKLAFSIVGKTEVVNTFDGNLTPERLMNRLTENGDGILATFADELSFFLGKQKYAEALIPYLLKLSDAPNKTQFERQGKGKQILITNSCLTGVWGTTPISLGQQIPETAHDDGFMSRIIWIYEEIAGEPDAMMASLSDNGDGQKRRELGEEKFNLLVSGLQKIGTLKGEFTYTEEARLWFIDWYGKHRKSNAGKGTGWTSRRHEHMCRVAMCFCAARLEQVVQVQDFIKIDEWLTEVEKGMPKAFAFIGRHGSSEQQKRILALFNRSDTELTTKEILRRTMMFFRDLKELMAALDTLRAAGYLRQTMYDASGGGNSAWMLSQDDKALKV